MTLTETNTDIPIVYVHTPQALEDCVHDLSHTPQFAFDLEFDRDRYQYGFNLCLLQIATHNTCYIIDPVANIDLQPLYRVFEKEEILKIVHCPGEDLRLLHSLQCYPKNVVDTEACAKLLNYEIPSLAVMLELTIGFKPAKKLQTSNWGKRPLTDAQILYAANDVLHLAALKDTLWQAATEKGLLSFVQEECDLLSTTIYGPENKDTYLKSGDIEALSLFNQFKLNELLKFRDQLAQSINKPVYQVIDEQLLRDIVFRKTNIAQWTELKGIHPRFKTHDFSKQLETKLKVIEQEAEEKGLSKKPPAKKYYSEEERNLFFERKAAMELDKTTLFVPIQQVLTERYGLHAARFILSNGTVNQLIKRDISLTNLKTNYRKKLVSGIAAELKIDIKDYETGGS